MSPVSREDGKVAVVALRQRQRGVRGGDRWSKSPRQFVAPLNAALLVAARGVLPLGCSEADPLKRDVRLVSLLCAITISRLKLLRPRWLFQTHAGPGG